MSGQRGVALVIVLWALTVIAVISANFTTANRDGLFLARNTVERAKAEALADAGIYRAVLAIVNQEAEPESGDGTSIVALSVSRVINGSSAETVSPDATVTSMISTSLKSPISGTLTSSIVAMAIPSLSRRNHKTSRRTSPSRWRRVAAKRAASAPSITRWS